MTFRYTDVDGDRLAVFTAQIPSQGPGVNFKTDPRGCSIPLDRLEELIAGVRDTGREAAEYAEQPSPPAALEPSEQPRLFHLQRDHDVSGVSGTGRVANGVLWPDGTVSLRWIGERPSTVHWDRLADAEHIHGHGGATRIVWPDEQQVADRSTVLRTAADAVFALDYDVMVGEEGDENLGSMQEAWDLGTIHATTLLRRLADEAQQQETTPAAHHVAVPAGSVCKCPGDCGHRPGAEAQQQPDTTPDAKPVCICGHPVLLHHEDVCLRTDCGCADVLETSALPEALEAVLTKRFTELGNQFAEMRVHEQGPDGWPSSRLVSPHMVAEALRELLRRTTDEQQ